MKTLAQQMAGYAVYHRDRRNRLTHFFGVPAIIFAILIPMGWLRVGLGEFELSLAMVFVAAVLVYYYLLDTALAVGMTLIVGPVLLLTESIATGLSLGTGLLIFAAAFTGGWALQLIGHLFEGRRPALVDNFWQVFVAPVFLLAELYFLCGYKRSVQREVDRLADLSRQERG